MNQHIQHIIDQATTTSRIQSHGAFGENESHDQLHIDLEVFAKLLITECCNIIDPTDNMKVSLETECALYSAIEEINEKFK